MPIDQSAANRQESKARDSRSEYESNATTQAWQDGINGADSPGQGLAEAGANGLDVSRFDSAWQQGVQEGDFSVDANEWEANLDGDAWLEAMSDASNWNIG